MGYIICYILYDNQKQESINPLLKLCLKDDPTQLPDISELIYSFYIEFLLTIQTKSLKAQNLIALYSKLENKDIKDSLALCIIYFEGKYIKRDIDKSIHNLLLAENQNHPQTQFYLSLIYYKYKYGENSINKAIHYFSLAANQNHPDAQCNLCIIYHVGKYVKGDINKAIHYYSLAAKQNHPGAQYNFGCIY